MAQQQLEVQDLTRRLASSEPAAWVLLRQRIAHLERRLRGCRCAARQKLAERSNREMLHFAVDKAFSLACAVERCGTSGSC